MEWEPVVQAFATVLPIAATLGAGWLQSHKHTVAAAAVQTGAGIAYDSWAAATRNGSLDWEAARVIALREGVAAAKQIAGTQDPALALGVQGALGKLLAADPSVNVGGSSTATATAAPGQSATAEAGPARLVEAT